MFFPHRYQMNTRCLLVPQKNNNADESDIIKNIEMLREKAKKSRFAPQKNKDLSDLSLTNRIYRFVLYFLLCLCILTFPYYSRDMH